MNILNKLSILESKYNVINTFKYKNTTQSGSNFINVEDMKLLASFIKFLRKKYD